MILSTESITMTLYNSIFFSILIPSLITILFFIFYLNENKCKYYDSFSSLFSLILCVFSPFCFVTFTIINNIFDIPISNHAVVSFFVIIFIFISFFTSYLYFWTESANDDNLDNYLNLSIKILDIDLNTKEKIFNELKRIIKNSIINKSENDFYISIQDFSLLIRTKLSFSDYLRYYVNKRDKLSFSEYLKYYTNEKNKFLNKFEVLIINPISNIDNTKVVYNLEVFLNKFELASIDEIQDEHFKLFEMLNI